MHGSAPRRCNRGRCKSPQGTCQVGDTHHLSCPACHAIDRADGVEDGNLYKPEHYTTRHESALWHSVLQTQDHVADRVTTFAGSLLFIYIHAAWFTVWILFNVGVFGRSREFDAYPFGLLTMVVSLEAIFLATFVMVTQNRQGRRADIRSELDFETNLRSEIWSVHVGTALGVDAEHVEQIVRQAVSGARSALEAAGGMVRTCRTAAKSDPQADGSGDPLTARN